MLQTGYASNGPGEIAKGSLAAMHTSALCAAQQAIQLWPILFPQCYIVRFRTIPVLHGESNYNLWPYSVPRACQSITLGSANADLCPVAALLDFLAVRGSSPGPPFQLENGNPLRRKEFA